MEFVILDENDDEQGPIDQETLEKWVEIDKVFPETKVRNALLGQWKTAKDFDFLEHHFREQESRVDEKKGFWDRTRDSMEKRKEKKPQDEKRTAFIHEYVPDPATPFLRISAGIYDFVVVGIFALIIYFTGALLVYLGLDVNKCFYYVFSAFFLGLVFYLGLSLGVFAQTIGMWYWGIFIVKNNNDEVYFLRAYVFALLTIVFGWVSPIVVYINPSRRSIGEIITGTKIIKIAAKPKA